MVRRANSVPRVRLHVGRLSGAGRALLHDVSAAAAHAVDQFRDQGDGADDHQDQTGRVHVETVGVVDLDGPIEDRTGGDQEEAGSEAHVDSFLAVHPIRGAHVLGCARDTRPYGPCNGGGCGRAHRRTAISQAVATTSAAAANMNGPNGISDLRPMRRVASSAMVTTALSTKARQLPRSRTRQPKKPSARPSTAASFTSPRPNLPP